MGFHFLWLLFRLCSALFFLKLRHDNAWCITHISLVMTCHLSVIWQFSVPSLINPILCLIFFMRLNRLEWLCHGVWLYKARVSPENMKRTNQTPHPSYLNTGKYHPACAKASRNKKPHVSHSPQNTQIHAMCLKPQPSRPPIWPNEHYFGVMRKYASVTHTFLQ